MTTDCTRGEMDWKAKVLEIRAVKGSCASLSLLRARARVYGEITEGAWAAARMSDLFAAISGTGDKWK